MLFYHHDFKASISGTVGPFKGSATVKNDFVRVDIETQGDVQRDIHMYVQPKKDVSTRKVTPLELPLNVILIMFDSTSAAHFHRKMKKTTAYLKEELTTVFMKGRLYIPDYILLNYSGKGECN